jgi:uncharacterized protein
MRVQRNLTVSAADGVRLLLNHHLPADRDGTPQPGAGVVVWIRTPYGRKGIASIANRFTKSGAHVIVEAMRGTDGCGGDYEPFSVTAADAAAVLTWLRDQPWFPGVIVTWGISAIGYASWALTELKVPEWRLAILQDAPSELRDGLVYPGGIFAAKTMLGFLHSVDWQARHPRASLPRTMLASSAPPAAPPGCSPSCHSTTPTKGCSATAWTTSTTGWPTNTTSSTGRRSTGAATPRPCRAWCI